MENIHFFRDLQYSMLSLGIDQLALILGVSVKTLNRYFKGTTKPQPRMIVNFYQKMYHHSRNQTHYVEHDFPSLEQNILLDLSFKKMNMADLERIHGIRGKLAGLEMLKNGLIVLDDLANLSIIPSHPRIPSSILKALGRIMSIDNSGPVFCEFHTMYLNSLGKNKLQDLMKDLGKKISYLRAYHHYAGKEPVVISTLARTFPFLSQ